MAIGGFVQYGPDDMKVDAFGSLQRGGDLREFFRKRSDDAALRKRFDAEDSPYMGNPEAMSYAQNGDYEAARSVMDRERRAQEAAAMLGLRASEGDLNRQLRYDQLNKEKAAKAAEKAAQDAAESENMGFLENTYSGLDELNKKAGTFTNKDPGWFSRQVAPTANDNWDQYQAKVMQMFSPYRRELTGSGATSDADMLNFFKAVGLNAQASPESRQAIVDSMMSKIRSAKGYSSASAGGGMPVGGSSGFKIERVE